MNPILPTITELGNYVAKDMRNRELGRAQMLALIEEYERGSETLRAFCQVKGLSKSTFGYWLRKYRTGESKHDTGFIPVQVHDTIGAGSLEVLYPGGVTVRFGDLVQVAYLGELLKPAE